MSGRVAPGGQSGSGADAKAVTRAANAGEIRKIRDGLYTSQPEEDWPDLTKRNARDIVAALFPGAVASWRSSSLFGSGEKMKLTNAFEEDLHNYKLLTAQSAAVRT